MIKAKAKLKPKVSQVDLAVGYHPPHALTPEDETLFRAFQSNLLSMISHELKTPLMGVINALSGLGLPESGIPKQELLDMASRNALRLQHTLSTLLDLASIESGMFHAQLREVDAVRIALSRLRAQSFWINEQGLRLESTVQSGENEPVLADPQKLGRAIDLCLQTVIAHAAKGSPLVFSSSPRGLHFRFQSVPGTEELWKNSWSQALVGFGSGINSPSSAFRVALQTEQDFLSRRGEGLGSEFLLIHEIMKLHLGIFEMRMIEKAPGQEAAGVELTLGLPTLSSEQALCTVLASRLDVVALDQGFLGSVALVLIEIPKGVDSQEFRRDLKSKLFRASDAVYCLPESGQIALILSDCRPEDAPRLIARLQKDQELRFRYGLVTAPEDGFDPGKLIELAQKELKTF